MDGITYNLYNSGSEEVHRFQVKELRGLRTQCLVLTSAAAYISVAEAICSKISKTWPNTEENSRYKFHAIPKRRDQTPNFQF
jgi:hypothetical protein